MSADATAGARAELARRIEAIERGYEFLLAYAAQGRTTDDGPGPGQRLREHLGSMEQAIDGLAAIVTACARERGAELEDAAAAFLRAVEEDAHKSRSSIRLVLAQPHIGSQLVDNLNASIHLRALLTDLFLIDEALKTNADRDASMR